MDSCKRRIQVACTLRDWGKTTWVLCLQQSFVNHKFVGFCCVSVIHIYSDFLNFFKVVGLFSDIVQQLTIPIYCLFIQGSLQIYKWPPNLGEEDKNIVGGDPNLGMFAGKCVCY